MTAQNVLNSCRILGLNVQTSSQEVQACDSLAIQTLTLKGNPFTQIPRSFKIWS